jgi:hypothetical protein
MIKADAEFRRGATHGAQWFRDVVRRMRKEGYSVEQIDNRLGDLKEVLADWRDNQPTNELPTGNP